jgi:CII-binding regulator of phage lambda lysogenization HflD
MTLVTMQHIPLASAYLCQDCNCVGNCATQCPACASTVLMALAAVLDREPEDTAQLNYSRFPALAA